MLGIGAVIGTGIFVLTSEAAQKAGPAMMISFVIAGFVCAVAALCYSELASMVPVAGSAYTYTYAVMGELLAWMVGWALILEYARRRQRGRGRLVRLFRRPARIVGAHTACPDGRLADPVGFLRAARSAA